MFVFVGNMFFNNTSLVMAAGSCMAVVSSSFVQTQTGTDFSFAITNTGSGTINFVKIVSPSTNFNLQNHGVPGWDVNANNTFAELTGGSVIAGDTLNFSYFASSGSVEAASENWQISTNDGTGMVSCTGSLGTSISGVRDVTPPNINDLNVSALTDSSATISWTTDEASNSNVDYGTTTDSVAPAQVIEEPPVLQVNNTENSSSSGSAGENQPQ